MVVVVEYVGRSMQSSDRLDLLLRNTKSKLQAIERGLHATQKCPIVNRNDVMYLLDLGRISYKLVNPVSFRSAARQTSWASAAPVAPANKPSIVVPAAAEQDANDLRVRLFRGFFLRDIHRQFPRHRHG
jgi:hypothetical protein